MAVSDAQKKLRIKESLKGPVAKAIRSLTAEGISLCMITSVYCRMSSDLPKAFSLLLRFEQTYHKRGERLSDYTRHLNRLLCQIVERKGIDIV